MAASNLPRDTIEVTKAQKVPGNCSCSRPRDAHFEGSGPDWGLNPDELGASWPGPPPVSCIPVPADARRSRPMLPARDGAPSLPHAVALLCAPGALPAGRPDDACKTLSEVDSPGWCCVVTTCA